MAHDLIMRHARPAVQPTRQRAGNEIAGAGHSMGQTFLSARDTEGLASSAAQPNGKVIFVLRPRQRHGLFRWRLSRTLLEQLDGSLVARFDPRLRIQPAAEDQDGEDQYGDLLWPADAQVDR